MKLLNMRACGLLLALLLAPALAMAQTATTTLPRGIYEPSGRSQVQTSPVALVTKDSVSGEWCIIGTSATCLMPGSGGGGGGSATLSPFGPTGNASLSVTTTSARVALPTSDDTAVLQNLGNVTACVTFGNSSVTSVLGSCTPLQPGMVATFNAGAATHVAAITSLSTATLSVTTGTGSPSFGLALDPTAAALVAYADPANLVSGVITSAMTGTTSTSLLAAPGSGLRNYLTEISCQNTHATVDTLVNVLDGSGGTVIAQLSAEADYGGHEKSFTPPLRQPTANTALHVVNVTTGASVTCSAAGFKGP